jgi:carboxylesterase type B
MDIIFGNVLGSPEPMITNDIYRALVGKVFRNDSLRVLSAYPPDAAGNITKNIDQIIELTTDYLARCPTIAMALRRSTAPVYLYSFDFVAEFPPKWFLQRCLTRHVCHAMEIPYVFHSMQHWPMLRKFSSAEQNISLSLISYWTEFASGEKLTLSNVLSHMPRWSNWYPVSSSNSTDQYYWMRFGLPDIARVNLGNPKRELCDLWESTGYRY